jgi:hypothetical protein
MHPHMALKKKHWDGVNYRHGNNCEWRKWKQVEDRDPADTAVYYERLKAFIQAVKEDPRFEIIDVAEMISSFKPRRIIASADIPAIRAALMKDFNTIRTPASWCVADAFQAAVRLLRGERAYDPSKVKVYGFLERPRGVTAETSVSASDLKAAADKIDLSTFIPSEINVGGRMIGPADCKAQSSAKMVLCAPCRFSQRNALFVTTETKVSFSSVDLRNFRLLFWELPENPSKNCLFFFSEQ